MFILVTITYKLASGSKPAWKHCILSATECTLCFWVVTIFFKLFLNITRYNLIYGLLSNLVISLLEIYIFFILFFLFAQQIFTHQFFNELLLSELYLLPSEEFNDFKSKIKRALFIRPDKLISNENMHISLKKDDNIYSKDEVSDGVYYVANGKIKLTKDNFTPASVSGDENSISHDFISTLFTVAQNSESSYIRIISQVNDESSPDFADFTVFFCPHDTPVKTNINVNKATIKRFINTP